MNTLVAERAAPPKYRDTSFICTNNRLDAEQVEVYVGLLVTRTRAADPLRLGLMTFTITLVHEDGPYHASLRRQTPTSSFAGTQSKHPHDHPCIFWS
jgi:hypothetical protein